MPDGNQGPFSYRPPHPETSPQAFNFPGAAQPSALSRALALGKKLTFGGLFDPAPGQVTDPRTSAADRRSRGRQ
jgi:hypothetical protein